jgi:hypothetical protein
MSGASAFDLGACIVRIDFLMPLKLIKRRLPRSGVLGFLPLRKKGNSLRVNLRKNLSRQIHPHISQSTH